MADSCLESESDSPVVRNAKYVKKESILVEVKEILGSKHSAQNEGKQVLTTSIFQNVLGEHDPPSFRSPDSLAVVNPYVLLFCFQNTGGQVGDKTYFF